MARRSRRMVRGDKTFVWCAMMSMDNAIAIGAAEEQIIVGGNDWFAGSGAGEATLKRIRGSVSVGLSQGAVAGSTIQVMIYKTKGSAPAYAVPVAVAALVDEDILMFRTFRIVSNTTEPGGAGQFELELDVKAQRRLDSGDDIRIMISNTLRGGTYTVSTRALVQV